MCAEGMWSLRAGTNAPVSPIVADAPASVHAVPGIMDNFVMLSAGDLIDNTLGVKFGLATLTAAACGQVVRNLVIKTATDSLATLGGSARPWLHGHLSAVSSFGPSVHKV